MADDKTADSAEAANDPSPRRRGGKAASNEPSKKAEPPNPADLQKEHDTHRAANEELPVVDLRVFATRHHLPVDQLAGFAAYAKVHHAGRRTIPEWNDLLAQFHNKVVK